MTSHLEIESDNSFRLFIRVICTKFALEKTLLTFNGSFQQVIHFSQADADVSYTRQQCTQRRYLDDDVADSQETPGALEPDQSSQSLTQKLRINAFHTDFLVTELGLP